MTRRRQLDSDSGELGQPAAGAAAAREGRIVLAGVTACFVLSGLAGLLYQTAWLRQFSLVFGTSEMAVATVLAAYMGGLAAGAAVAGRYLTRVRRPILAYGVLEAGIAISALAVPWLLTGASALYASVLGEQPTPPDAATIGQPVFYLVVTFLVLALPTGCMGATLPLLTRYAVRSDREVGPRVALLYAANTAGAVAGTVIAAFVLLPGLGLNGTVWVGVFVNGLVFVVAACLARSAPVMHAAEPGPAADGSAAAFESKSSFSNRPGWILPLMLVSGANAFLYEVLWTRMLAHVMGGSIYAFATMLAAFLTGIALGGGLAGRVAAQRDRAAIAFAVSQLAIGVLSIGVYAWMGPLIPTDQTTGRMALYAVMVMLPATFFIGVTFPLAVRILARDESEASVGAARVYSWNTLGGIAGSVLAAFLVIPALGFEGSIKLAVVVNCGLALAAAAFLARRKPGYAVAAVTALVAALLAYHPTRPQAVVSNTGFALNYGGAAREIFYRVGRTTTVLLLEEGGYYYLRTNGLPEASIASKGSVPALEPEKWLTALAVTARPNARDMLVIGFGGGVALEGIPPSVERVDVIELEPAVIDANRALAGARNIDPLDDSRINLIINDARNALRLSTRTYDAIVSQPSHPWTAGASHLFTREFVASAKSHLNAGGVFVQWMSSEFVDESLLRTLAATLLAEYANVHLYQPSAQVLMFLASDASLDTEIAVAQSGRPFAADIMHYGRLGMNGVEDLVAALAMDQAGVEDFARDAPISTDDDNRMATQSRSRGDGLPLPRLLELFRAYDPLLRRGSWVYSRLGNDLDFGYLTRRLIFLGQLQRAAQMADLIPDTSTRLEIHGLLHAATGKAQLADEAFRAALVARPGNAQARYHVIENHIGAIGRGEAPEDIRAIVAGLSGSAAALPLGWAANVSGDWASLAQLDAELAQSEITDAWYPEAARLRAKWRTRVSADPKRYSFDAVRLIDRALVLVFDRNLLLLRSAAAVILEDDDLLLESSRNIASSIRGDLLAAKSQGVLISALDLTRMTQNLAAIDARLSRGLDVVDPGRVTGVADSVREVMREVETHRGGEALLSD